MSITTTPPTVAPAIIPVWCTVGAARAGPAVALAADEVELVKELASELVDGDDVDVIKLVDVIVDEMREEEVLEEGDAAVDGEPEGEKGAASAGFEDRNPPVRSPSGQPLSQGLLLQHPINGGSVSLHVYH